MDNNYNPSSAPPRGSLTALGLTILVGRGTITAESSYRPNFSSQNYREYIIRNAGSITSCPYNKFIEFCSCCILIYEFGVRDDTNIIEFISYIPVNPSFSLLYYHPSLSRLPPPTHVSPPH